MRGIYFAAATFFDSGRSLALAVLWFLFRQDAAPAAAEFAVAVAAAGGADGGSAGVAVAFARRLCSSPALQWKWRVKCRRGSKSSDRRQSRPISNLTTLLQTHASIYPCSPIPAHFKRTARGMRAAALPAAIIIVRGRSAVRRASYVQVMRKFPSSSPSPPPSIGTRQVLVAFAYFHRIIEAEKRGERRKGDEGREGGEGETRAAA